MKCINKAVGASFLCQWSEDYDFQKTSSGLSLSMSSDEKETMFRKYVENDSITEETLDFWKKSSYDYLLLPYVRNADIVVIDHGYNDNFSLQKIYDEGEANIDWNTDDRTSFIGAFNFIYRLIRDNNPEAKVILGGYFQDKCTTDYFIRGKWTATVLTWMARHYDLALLDVWNYTDIPDGYMPDSQDYLSLLNEQYGKSFEKLFPDEDGNITWFQKFCPDGVHPYSDPTGHSDQTLNRIFSDMLFQVTNELEASNP